MILSYGNFAPQSPDGPVLCFLHGFMGSSWDWEDLIPFFSTHRIICPDLPGHGNSVHLIGEYSFERTAAAVISLFDSLSIKRAILAGYSMGGRLALFIALRFPERVQGLVLESSSPGIRLPLLRQKRRRADENLASKLERTTDFTLFLKEWYAQPLFDSLRQHPRFQELLQKRANNLPRELAKSLRHGGSGVQPNLWPELKQLACPVLVLTGSYDTKFYQIARDMCVFSPLIRHISVLNAGHTVHFEEPASFVHALQQFIKEA